MSNLPPIGSRVVVRGSTWCYIVQGYVTTLPFLGEVTHIFVRCGKTIRVFPLDEIIDFFEEKQKEV